MKQARVVIPPERFKDAQRQLEFSNMKFAIAIGVSVKTVGRWKRTESLIPFDIVMKVQKLLEAKENETLHQILS